MKKSLLLIIPTLLFICCQPKTVEVEVNASAGEQFLNNFKGKKYIFGSDEDAYNAVSLVLAYAEKLIDYPLPQSNDRKIPNFKHLRGGKHVLIMQ